MHSDSVHNAVETCDSDAFSQGLGLLPTIVQQDTFNHGFLGAGFEAEPPMGHDKIHSDFVGESADLSSLQKRSSTFSYPISRVSQSVSPGTALSSSPELLTANAPVIDADHVPALTYPTSVVPVSHFSSLPTSVPLQQFAEPVFKSPTTPASAYPKTPSVHSPVEHRLHAHGVHSTNTLKQQHSPQPMPQHGGPFQHHFFAQSSGNFIPPLETTCSFSLLQAAFPSLLYALCFLIFVSIHRRLDACADVTLCIDPSLISEPRHFNEGQFADQTMFANSVNSFSSVSPAGSPAPSPSYAAYPQTQFSPHMTPENYAHPYSRRQSIASYHSGSYASPSSEFNDDGERGRCPHPDCGKVFKDLKAHMLTHQAERPEKCPILTCEYNQKGFARKYDKNRHTLTHYKGTMVCGFCPGSGSAAEKSFNRADVFKRHLTSVHGVEQTPPNSRKRSPASSARKLSSYCQDATGKCSTCSATFSNAQDFYEHLDDCVLRVVQQEEPSEAINAQHLSSVSSDRGVQETMDRHYIKTEEIPTSFEDEDEEEEEDDDDEDPSFNGRSGKGIKSNKAGRAVLSGAIAKKSKAGQKAFTWSKGGVALVGKGRKKRKHYPPSWGMSAEKMQMKKRVLCVYDGERRLWKDDMMLHNEFEVRMPLPDGKNYVTDLDVETLNRAEAFHSATDEERGPWMAEEMGQMAPVDLNQLMTFDH